LNVSSGGLNAQGQWVWNVTITPSATGTPLAAELGFRETTAGSQLVNATKNAAVWDTDNPGVQIFNWETLTDVDPSPTVTNNRPVGLQTNVTNDEVFSAIGSIDLTSGAAVQYITITTKGPTAANPTSTIAVVGKHGTGSTNGRIAEITGTAATNYSNFTGSATRTAFPGDANLDGNVNFDDVLVLSPNFNKTVTNGWAGADFTGDGNVNFDDVLALSPNFGKSGGTNTPLNVAGVAGGAAAGLGASSVPEPTSVILVALGSMMLAGLGLRKTRKS
jgi:hypothetical protein